MKALPEIIQTEDGPSASRTGPEVLTAVLSQFEHEVAAAGAPIDRLIQHGLSPDQIHTVLAAEGLGAPDELVALYSWRNGMRDGGWEDSDQPWIEPAAYRVLPRWDFPSLQAAIANYRSSMQYQQAAIAAHPDRPLEAIYQGTGPGWLRLTQNLIGCSIDCMGDPQTAPRLRYNDPEFGTESNKHFFRAVSLVTWITWLIEGIRSGAYLWNSDAQSWIEDWSLTPESQRDVWFA